MSYAQSIDGCIATRSGDSKWISSDATLELSQQFRRDNDAIVVGIGTVNRDDPLLTCRLPGCESPVRVVLDSQLRIGLESQIVTTAKDVRTIVCSILHPPVSRQDALSERGVEVCQLGSAAYGLDLRDLVRLLEEKGLGSIYVEGGGQVITSFLNERLVDRCVVVTAPIIIGDGVRAFGDIGVDRLADALRPDLQTYQRIGQETVHEFLLGRNCA